MKKLIHLLLLLFLCNTAIAQYYPIDTLRLNRAYHSIINGNNTYENQLDFFNTFPSTWLEYTLTYLYSPAKEFDIKMSQMATEHCCSIKYDLFCDRTSCNSNLFVIFVKTIRSFLLFRIV